MRLKPKPVTHDCVPLNDLLERARLSCLRQADLANGIGVRPSSISQIVRGNNGAHVATLRLLEQFITAHERALVDHLVSVPHARQRMRERLNEEA